VRLFVALRPSAAALASLADALGVAVDPRWHLTLAFVGEQPDAEPFLEPLAAVAARSAAVELLLSGGLTFGGRVLAASVTGDVAALSRLAHAVQEVCRSAGAAVDDRPYRPHLTLARGRRLTVPAGLAGYEGPVWRADVVELVRSHLGHRSRHEVLHRFPLRPT
jgi:2'-5' RNA ligase